VLNDKTLGEWCREHLEDGLGSVLFRSGHLSEVVGVQLDSGRQVVIKARPYDPRLMGCLAVQDHLARSGFPCPAPLTGVTRLGGLAVTAETAMPGGDQLSAESGAAPFAALLARLIDSAPDSSRTPPLAPSPPWTGWDHPGARLWPDADDVGRDLNLLTAPAWIDEAAGRVRVRLTSAGASVRIGHGDWESQNIAWASEAPLAVHDWDSVIAQPETSIVGLAAAVWAATGEPGGAASVAQTQDFIASYQSATSRPWGQSEVQDAWAAGLWVRLFNSRKDAADGGGPQLDRLEGEVGERLAFAALD
jgi:Ser/Thr protein kinase RdoA (MazF antagonist)